MNYTKEINAGGYKLVCLFFFGERNIGWWEEVESTIADLHRLIQEALAACDQEEISSKEFRNAVSAANTMFSEFDFIVPCEKIEV